MPAAEMIHRVRGLDLKSYRNSPGYLLHLILAPTACCGEAVTTAVRGMYRRVPHRWHAACRVAFKEFDVELRPGVSLESLSRALAVLADGVALEVISTGGNSSATEDSDVEMMAEIAMTSASSSPKSSRRLRQAVNASPTSAVSRPNQARARQAHYRRRRSSQTQMKLEY
jgi:hypothetical protein